MGGVITIGVESDEEEAAVVAAMADGSLEAALGRGFVIRKSGASGVGYIFPVSGGGSGDVGEPWMTIGVGGLGPPTSIGGASGSR